MKKKIWKMLFSVLACTIVIMGSSNIAMAAEFDPNYYANRYPDVVSVLGTSTDALYQHYLTYGMNEGRYPYQGATPGEKVDGVDRMVTVTIGSETTGFTPVAIDKLANYKSLKKKMSDAEFQQAYNVALQIVTPLADTAIGFR